jgi:cation transport ATPase
MSNFKSSKEKRLWFWASMVMVLIFSTLFLGQPLAELFNDQNVRAAVFLVVMFLIGAAILFHALKTKPGKIEITLLLGIAAVYIMFILRLGMPERSHLMEYSVLAILIHKALIERGSQGEKVRLPALSAIVISFLIGVVDECLQIFLPDRVFDPQDILFNGMAVTMAVGSFVVINWARKRFGKS